MTVTEDGLFMEHGGRWFRLLKPGLGTQDAIDRRRAIDRGEPAEVLETAFHMVEENPPDWSQRDNLDWDFSQSGEQKWIEAFAARDTPGRFLDIGAYDGVTGSNSRWLALHGWEGVCVEPAAAPFHALAELYADRPDVMCVQALVGQTAGLQRFWYSPTDLVSTADAAHHALWKDAARFVETFVCQITLGQLLDSDVLGFDVVSIDTEGTSIELLKALRSSPTWPGLGVGFIVVEFADGEQEYEIHEICGMGEWDVLERTSNNVVLERI